MGVTHIARCHDPRRRGSSYLPARASGKAVSRWQRCETGRTHDERADQIQNNGTSLADPTLRGGRAPKGSGSSSFRNTRVMPVEGSKASRLEFEQSQLAGAVLSPKQLHRLAADYIPQLSEEGLLRRRTFELMDGTASLEEIAHKLAAEFPKRFSSWQQALSYAGLNSQEFSR